MAVMSRNWQVGAPSRAVAIGGKFKGVMMTNAVQKFLPQPRRVCSANAKGVAKYACLVSAVQMRRIKAIILYLANI